MMSGCLRAVRYATVGEERAVEEGLYPIAEVDKSFDSRHTK